jgi:hypothetical protein
MDCYEVDALICLKDDLGIEYVVSAIEYKIWKNEEFEYKFIPNYSVIELLDTTLFQGIPGIDLEHRKKEYIRKNHIPTFISERAPSSNRQELWKLLEDCNMQYLNQLEWLIRTDTKYIGDRLYVRKPYSQNFSDTIHLDNEIAKSKKSYDIQKKLLDGICAGFNIEYEEFIINDSNRKTCYDLLYRLFSQECKRLRKLQSDGISKAKSEGKYKGRKSIPIDDTKLYEVWRKYKNKKITLEEATNLLNISVSTFYRRIKNFQ